MGVVLGWQRGNGLVEEVLLEVSSDLFQKKMQNWTKFDPHLSLYESSPLLLFFSGYQRGIKEEMTKKEQWTGKSEGNN